MEATWRKWILHCHHLREAASAGLSRSCRLVHRRTNKPLPRMNGFVSGRFARILDSSLFALDLTCFFPSARNVGCSAWALAPCSCGAVFFFIISNPLALRILPCVTLEGARVQWLPVLLVVSFIMDVSGVIGCKTDRMPKTCTEKHQPEAQ